MKILIINPTMSDKNIWNVSIPHIGIGYIAAVLEQHGHQVTLLDFPSMDISIKDVMDAMEREQFEVVGISLYFYNKVVAKKIASKIRRKYNCFLYLGGYYPTLSTQNTCDIFKEADCLVLGEGEVTTLDLIEHLEKGEDWHNIPGIAYVKDNQIIKTETRALMQNLDEVPFPKRPEGINTRYLPVITSRGCYGRCSFCGVMEFYMCNSGARRRFRGVENVVQEIKELVEEKNTQCILVNDETFFDASKNRKEWLTQFIERLNEEQIEVSFQCQARANDVIFNYELIDRMVNMGMNRLFVGLESFTQRQLDTYRKDMKVETNIEAVKLLHNLKTQMFFGFILFDPLITLDEIKENIHVIQSVKLCALASPEEERPFSMSVLLVIEGTKIYEDIKALNLSHVNERGYTFLHPEVEYLYGILQLWHQHLEPICKNMYRIFFVRGKNDAVYQSLVEIKQRYMELDLEYLEFLCNLVEKNMERDAIVQMSELYYERVDKITEEFMEVVQQCNRADIPWLA